jgi:hypothetical protein
MPFVPRLSLIVPFQRDETALECTLLSVLESRTDADELIVVHTGDFSDPYELGRDEALVLETEPSLPLAEQLNLAARTACSPLIQVLLPGSVVKPGWADNAVSRMGHPNIHAVSMAMLDTTTGAECFGFQASEMPHRRLADSPSNVGGPVLAGTMIRRRSLLKLGGWCDVVPAALIDLELALLMQAIELQTVATNSIAIEAPGTCVTPCHSSFEIGKGCGMIACGYSEIADSHVSIEPLVRRLGHLASGLMNPKSAAERLGWVLGVRDRSLVRRIAERVELARQAFEAHQTVPMPIPLPDERLETRRAA